MKPICTFAIGAVQVRPTLFTRQRKRLILSIERGGTLKDSFLVGNGNKQTMQAHLF